MLSGDISRCHRYVGSWKRKNSFRCWANLIPFWSEDSAGKLLGSGINKRRACADILLVARQGTSVLD